VIFTAPLPSGWRGEAEAAANEVRPVAKKASAKRFVSNIF